MQNLEIKEDEESLAVQLLASGELNFSGRSFPEDSQEFFAPVINWLNEYKSNPRTKTVANFDISYFNSTSSLHLLRLLQTLDGIHKAGNDVLVIWSHAKNDELMADRAAEMHSMVELPFEIKII